MAEAQKGVMFAAFLKLLMPVIIVLPGIAAVVLAPDLAEAGRGLSDDDAAAARGRYSAWSSRR